jgi:hypothetical protein
MASRKKHCLHRLVWGTKLKKRYACSSTCFSLEPIGDEQHRVLLKARGPERPMRGIMEHAQGWCK